MSNTYELVRPTTFDEVKGQAAAVKSLSAVLGREEPEHCFLLSGPSGVGKTTMARIIADTVGCTKDELVEIDAATFSGVDDMRSITELMSVRPLTGNCRVAIIDECHALSKSAWQSLLKALESPHPTAYWVLCTTEVSKVPKTAQSRCLKYSLKVLKADVIEEILWDAAVATDWNVFDDEETMNKVVKRVAEIAEGNARAALCTLASLDGSEDVAGLDKLAGIGEASPEVIEICRKLVSGRLNWKDIKGTLGPIREVDAEGIRRMICGYLTSCLDSPRNPKDVVKLLSLLDCFADPYPENRGYFLLLSLGRAIFDTE